MMVRGVPVVIAILCFAEARDLHPVHKPMASFGLSPYIIGGRDVSILDFPHQISLQYSSGSHICGGSIIAVGRIVSAAHCSQGSASSYRIRAGSTSRSSGGQIRHISKIINHPGYCGTCPGFPNDISLLILEEDLIYGSSAQAIVLASGSDFAGQTCTITGWGRTDPSNNLPATLQGVDISVISNTDCRSRLSSVSGAEVNKGHICIFDTKKNAGSCNGDSGGPLKCGNALAGVTSWGISSWGACRQDFPSIYTRVSEYKNWLQAAQ